MVAILLALPAAAGAYEQPARQPSASFRVKASHGYRVTVSASPRSANLTVSKGGRKGVGIELAQYTVSKPIGDGDEFEADFGHLGRIAVRFVPSNHVRRSPLPACEGGSKLTRFGTFEGTIRFSGEGGYADVHRTRAEGRVVSVPRLECDARRIPGERHARKHRGHLGKHQAPLVTSFSATSDKDGVFLAASHLEGEPASNSILAISLEHERRVRIMREVITYGLGAVFTTDSGLSTATLESPPPFSGSGTYQRVDEYTTRWDGSLAVSFPGRPDVALTGRHFSWSLDRTRAGFGSSAIAVSTSGGFG